MSNCDKGFKGLCCCNCKHQVKIRKHPLNDGFANDSITQHLGYGCARFDNAPIITGNNDRVIIFSDDKHGMCQLHCKIKE